MEAGEVEARIGAEIHRIVAWLEEWSELPSRWNGVVELVPGAAFFGQKTFGCGIRIAAYLADEAIRWRTLIHEALHSISAGYTRAAYDAFPGWEEGVVEQAQRLCRPRMLRALALEVDETVLAAVEGDHPYNRYVDALEEVRAALERPGEEFYLDLLRTPLESRPGFVLGLGRVRFGAGYGEFLGVFARANGALRR